MKTVKKIVALFLVVTLVGGMAGCGAAKCNCPKFSIEANDILE